MLLCKLLLWRQKKLLVLKGTKIGKGKSTWDWPVSLELVGAAIRLAQVRPFRQQLWHLWKRAPMLGWPDLWRVIWRYLKIYEVCNYTNNSMFFIWSIYMGHSLSQNLQLETHWKHGPTGPELQFSVACEKRLWWLEADFGGGILRKKCWRIPPTGEFL